MSIMSKAKAKALGIDNSRKGTKSKLKKPLNDEYVLDFMNMELTVQMVNNKIRAVIDGKPGMRHTVQHSMCL